MGDLSETQTITE